MDTSYLLELIIWIFHLSAVIDLTLQVPNAKSAICFYLRTKIEDIYWIQAWPFCKFFSFYFQIFLLGKYHLIIFDFSLLSIPPFAVWSILPRSTIWKCSAHHLLWFLQHMLMILISLIILDFTDINYSLQFRSLAATVNITSIFYCWI